MKYKVGVVSGKFRLLHIGHKEVMLQAAKEDIEELYVIAHVNEEYKRYSTVQGLEKSIQSILRQIDKKTKLILTYKKYESITAWEDFVIQTIGHTSVLMFNSKEDYQNERLDNKFIHCECSSEISVTEIEKDLAGELATKYIVEEFKENISNKVRL